MVKMRNSRKICLRISEEKRPLGRPRYRDGDNIKMNLKIWGEWAWTGQIPVASCCKDNDTSGSTKKRNIF
jgi:hypothetical protein